MALPLLRGVHAGGEIYQCVQEWPLLKGRFTRPEEDLAHSYSTVNLEMCEWQKFAVREGL